MILQVSWPQPDTPQGAIFMLGLFVLAGAMALMLLWNPKD